MAAISQKVEGAQLAITKNMLGAMTSGGAAVELEVGETSKMTVSKKTPADVAGAPQAITSKSGKTIEFNMPASLPAGLTGETDVGIKMASSTTPYADPNGAMSMSESVSLTFTTTAGAEITGLDFSADPITFTVPLGYPYDEGVSCYFWDGTAGEYSATGIAVISTTKTSVTCSTTHLTTFSGGGTFTTAAAQADADFMYRKRFKNVHGYGAPGQNVASASCSNDCSGHGSCVNWGECLCYARQGCEFKDKFKLYIEALDGDS